MAAHSKVEAALRALALSLPEAYEDFPWGDRVFKVREEIFLFLQGRGLAPQPGRQAPDSREAALMMPFAEPTGYNLGKAGWVTATFEGFEKAPQPLLEGWVVESYRAVAPAKLVKLLDSCPVATPPPKKPKARGRRST